MKTLVKPLNWDEVQGARRAETAVYVLIHEAFEHCAMPQFAQVCGFRL